MTTQPEPTRAHRPATDTQLDTYRRLLRNLDSPAKSLQLLLSAELADGMPAVLARLADAEDRLAQIADSLTPCTPGDAPFGPDFCTHGAWPCPQTEAAWLARGLDPAEQITAARTPAPQPAGCPECGDPTSDGPCTTNGPTMSPTVPTCAQIRAAEQESTTTDCPVCGASTGGSPCTKPPAGSPPGTASCADILAEAQTDPEHGDIWLVDALGGTIWHARRTTGGGVELFEPNGPGQIPAGDVGQLRGGMTLVFRASDDTGTQQ